MFRQAGPRTVESWSAEVSRVEDQTGDVRVVEVGGFGDLELILLRLGHPGRVPVPPVMVDDRIEDAKEVCGIAHSDADRSKSTRFLHV